MIIKFEISLSNVIQKFQEKSNYSKILQVQQCLLNYKIIRN